MAQHEIGMIGLGVMGRNLLLNMADHGFPVAGFEPRQARPARVAVPGRRPLRPG